MNKELGFFAKHTEKIILGVAVLLLVLVAAYAWLGVLGDPHATASGDGPDDVEENIEAAAERVTARLRSEETGLPTAEEYIVPDYATEFDNDYNQPVTLATAYPAKADSLGIPGLGDIESVEFDPLFLPTPPLASSFSIKAKHGVLADPTSINDAQLRNQVVEVQQIVGDRAPVDFQYVSVMAEFPLRDWAERLDANDQPANAQIPDNVWLSKLGIAAVYLVREEQDADGQWGNRTIIEPVPGQLAIMPNDPPLADEPVAAQQLLLQTQERQPQIVQPMFPPMALENWTPPTGRDRILSPEENKQLSDLESDIRNLERRINALTGRDDPRRPERQQRQPRGNEFGGMGGDVGGMGGMGVGGANNRQRPDRGNAAAERQQQQIERMETELREKVTEKNELLGIDDDTAQMDFMRNRGGMGMMDGMGMGGMGGGMGGMGGGMGGMGGGMGGMDEFGGRGMGAAQQRPPAGVGAGMPARPTDDVPETIRIWAHDLTAQPGKTYRYKLVAAAINPLYQYTRLPSDQRKANEFKLALAPSEEDFNSAPWTTPVTLDPEAYFFFVRGNADQDRATVEVWKVYNGQWRQSEFEEIPGNLIGGEQPIELAANFMRSVNMGVGAVLLDVDVVDFNGTSQVRMVYLLNDGSIASRLLNEDRRNLKREELEREAEEQRQLFNPDFALRQ